MMSKKLITAVAAAGILSASVSTAAHADVNRVRDRNVAIGVGLIGAAMLGSAIANNNNRVAAPTYYAPPPAYYRPAPVYYGRPAYGGWGYGRRW